MRRFIKNNQIKSGSMQLHQHMMHTQDDRIHSMIKSQYDYYVTINGNFRSGEEENHLQYEETCFASFISRDPKCCCGLL